jgi:hypothetical protein
LPFCFVGFVKNVHCSDFCQRVNNGNCLQPGAIASVHTHHQHQVTLQMLAQLFQPFWRVRAMLDQQAINKATQQAQIRFAGSTFAGR